MYEERGTKSFRNRYSGKGRLRDGHVQHSSNMNQSRYRYNKKYDPSSTIGYSNPKLYHRSWHSNTSYYANYEDEKNYSSCFEGPHNQVTSAPKYVYSTYASMADSVEKREQVDYNHHSPAVKRDDTSSISKLSILPTCDTVDTIIGSIEDMSNGILTAPSSFEQKEVVSDENREVSRRIFSDTTKADAKIPISTYYRDRIANIGEGSLFLVSPKSFLFGKKATTM